MQLLKEKFLKIFLLMPILPAMAILHQKRRFAVFLRQICSNQYSQGGLAKIAKKKMPPKNDLWTLLLHIKKLKKVQKKSNLFEKVRKISKKFQFVQNSSKNFKFVQDFSIFCRENSRGNNSAFAEGKRSEK